MAPLERALLLAYILLIFGYPITNARFLTMRPLNAREVYRLLHESGRSDAIPQGRVITQGLAAMTGFALGLTKGLGSALLFDIITANVTDLNLNGGSSSNSGSGTTFSTQELCFNSRNARSLEEAEAIAEAYSRDDDSKVQEKRRVRPSEVERRVTRNRRNKRRKSQRNRKPGRLTLKKRGGLATATGTQTGTATNTETTSPTTRAQTGTGTNESENSEAIAIPVAETTGSGTNVDNGQGTGTTSTSTTSTGNEGAINCVVIQKPTTAR